MEIMAPGKSLVPLEQLKGMMAKSEGFSPEGLGVLVVDDDPLCLLILDRMLRMCKYNVTTCTRAMEALAFLREKREKFDLVISDVYMPDMDGFKLLELIGLEMDLPVIMMSADGKTDVVMKGITHGACDYLLKPVRMEELRNIWQHVLRRRNSRDSTKDEASGEWDDNEKALEVYCDTDSGSQKRKERFEFDDQFDNINSMKKARVVWSFDLHQQFVNAVNMLGVDKAVPKRILEIMNVQGLTRENVASHLQKYRLYLKRLSGVNPQPLPVASFQASEGGHFKGSMHVQPGGRNTCASVGPKSTINSGLFGRSLGQLDVGTLTTLAQLQAFEQRQVARHGQRIEDYDPTMYISQLTPIHTTSSNTEMVNIQELSGLQSESDILMKPHATVRPASIFEGDSPFRVADASSGAIPTFASNQAKDFRGDLINDNLTVMPNAPSNLATECNIDDLRDLTNLRSITQEQVTFVEGDTRSRSNQPARFAADIGASLAFSPANYHFNMGDVIDSGFGVGSDDFLLNIPPGVQGSILNTVFPCQEGKQVNHFL